MKPAYDSPARAAYRLASDDLQLREVMPENIEAGYFRADCDPAVFYDKCEQYRALSRLDPGLAFSAQVLGSCAELSGYTQGDWVVRPAISPHSRGCAVLLGEHGIAAAEAGLQVVPGPLLVHRHEAGYTVFINGVLEEGQFQVSDAWRCHTQDWLARRILTAVTSLPPAALPADLVPRLARLASGLGLLYGPLHAEVVITAQGPRLVKLAPRLASTPLPELCQLGGWPSQQDLWQKRPVVDVASAAQAVADYSFVITRPGRVLAMRFDQQVRALSSFSHYFLAPPTGQWVQTTTDGTTYGCTVFLRNSSAEALEADIAQLQALNLTDAFVFG
ncbi:hypothetical protein AB688_23755 [Pseudomonas putida]|uniref:hypothetical protein n=1 Tax=Pseudomonas putida TaxID=303 RepID=UPI0007B6AFB7|nr:hypothetical protein [Pseudomonas putida]ANC04969.1 hypothetical protein AB688_23755 [Pseudomonas putida]